MKKQLYIFILIFKFLLQNQVISQNLVHNPSFENYKKIPFPSGNIIDSFVFDWHTPINHISTNDYFHTDVFPVNSNNWSIPLNIAGNQDTCLGNAYAGIIIYSLDVSNNTANYREYLTGKLKEKLTVNKCYKVSFKYSLGESFTSYIINDFGIYFSDSIPINNANNYPFNNLNYIPQIKVNQYLNDAINWIQIERYYLAQDEYNYLTLGNFNDNVSTNVIYEGNNPQLGVYYSYIYLDDIHVEEVPLQTLPQLNLGADTILCEGEELTFSDLLPDSTVYVWNQLSNDTSFTIDSTGTYKLEAYNGCSYTSDEIYVEFVEPIVELGNDILTCKREVIMLQNLNETTNHPQAEFNWYKETQLLSTEQQVNITEEGIYSLTANIGHCLDSDTIEVNYEIPENSIFQTQNLDTTFCVSGILDASSTVWSDAYIWNTEEETQTIEVTETGTYEVYAENECTEATSTFNVIIEQLEEGLNNYNIISPNNDFVNDLFTIYEGNSEEYQIQTFNRWGKLIWQSDEPTNHWTAEGISDGVYYYNLSFRNCASETIEKKGTVEVKR